MARLYADEDFPYPTVLALRELGHDVVTIHDRGFSNEGTPDGFVLELAVAENRAVLTFNRKDFRRLHQKMPKHAGILICRSDLDHEGLARRIDAALRVRISLSNELVRINRPDKSHPRKRP